MLFPPNPLKMFSSENWQFCCLHSFICHLHAHWTPIHGREGQLCPCCLLLPKILRGLLSLVLHTLLPGSFKILGLVKRGWG